MPGLKCTVEHLVEFHFAPEGMVRVATERDVDLIVMGVRESGTKAPRLAAHMPWAIAHEVGLPRRMPGDCTVGRMPAGAAYDGLGALSPALLISSLASATRARQSLLHGWGKHLAVVKALATKRNA